MTISTKDHPPLVSLFTNYEKKTVEILVGGQNGTLSLELYQEGPTIVIKDPKRGPHKMKVVCDLKVNGQIRGGFATQDSDHLVWFPARKPRKRPVKGRQAPKSVRKEG
jgi:hypothetical protein